MPSQMNVLQSSSYDIWHETKSVWVCVWCLPVVTRRIDSFSWLSASNRREEHGIFFCIYLNVSLTIHLVFLLISSVLASQSPWPNTLPPGLSQSLRSPGYNTYTQSHLLSHSRVITPLLPVPTEGLMLETGLPPSLPLAPQRQLWLRS